MRSDRPIFSAAEVDELRGQLRNAAARQALGGADLDTKIENRLISISTQAGVYLRHHGVGEIRDTKARDLAQNKLAHALTKFADEIEKSPTVVKESVWWIDYLTKMNPETTPTMAKKHGVDRVVEVLRQAATDWAVNNRRGPKETQTDLRSFVLTLVNTWTSITRGTPGMSPKGDTVYQFVSTVLKFVNARIPGTGITRNQIENALKSAIRRRK